MSVRLVMVGSLLLVACNAKRETSQADTSRPATTSSAKQVAIAYIDAWNRHDSAAIDTLIAPQGTHEDMPSGFVATGPSGVRGMMKDLTQSLPDYAWTVTDVLDGDPKLAVLWTWKGTFSGQNPAGKTVKNQPVNGKGMSLVVVENGKIKQMQNYYDEASLFKGAKP